MAAHEVCGDDVIAVLRYNPKSLRRILKRAFEFLWEISLLGRRPRSFAPPPERRCGVGGGGVRVLLLLPVWRGHCDRVVSAVKGAFEHPLNTYVCR